MTLLGITGGPGMGKSTVSGFLEKHGIAVVDTDDLARAAVMPGQPGLREIQGVFGAGMIDDEGCLRRDRLAEVVFNDSQARKKLESILHPQIRELWLAEVERWRKRRLANGVVVIPLLFETEAADYFDSIWCVACTAATQARRLRDRGWTAEQIEQRRQAQLPIGRKMELSDFVIWSEGTIAATHSQLRRILPSRLQSI